MGCLSRLSKGVNKMPEYTMKLNIPKLVDSDTFNTTTFGAIVDAIDENAADQLSLDEHIRDYTSHVHYYATTGIANNYTVSIPKGFILVEGLAIAVKINVNNSGISTINIGSSGAKTIKKANGNDVAAGQLKAGSIYTLRYNGTNFILQGDVATGNATASDIISGKTASTDAGDITGTMLNRGIGGTVIPSTTDQTKQSGYYSSDIVIKGDANLVATNIKKDINLFGIVGTLDVSALGGKRFAKGVINQPVNDAIIRVSGLSFRPKYILIFDSANNIMVYNYDQSTTTYFAASTVNPGYLTITGGTDSNINDTGFALSRGYNTASVIVTNWIAFE
jgi:hypothetical protein